MFLSGYSNWFYGNPFRQKLNKILNCRVSVFITDNILLLKSMLNEIRIMNKGRKEQKMTERNFLKKWDTQVELGCRVEANWPHVGPGPTQGVHAIGVFLKDPSLYLREFRRKLRTAGLTNLTGDSTCYLSSTNIEGRSTQLLVGQGVIAQEFMAFSAGNKFIVAIFVNLENQRNFTKINWTPVVLQLLISLIEASS